MDNGKSGEDVEDGEEEGTWGETRDGGPFSVQLSDPVFSIIYYQKQVTPTAH